MKIQYLLHGLALFQLLSCSGLNSNYTSGMVSKDSGQAYLNEMVKERAILAYLRNDEPSIYVTKGNEDQIASKLNAKIEKHIWLLPEDNYSIKHPLKTIDWRTAQPRLYIVKWALLNGYSCTEIPKDSCIPVRNGKGRVIRSYRTPEKTTICVKVDKPVYNIEYVCKFIRKNIQLDFYKKRGCTGPPKLESGDLAVCFDR